jgi:hypothetical protein
MSTPGNPRWRAVLSVFALGAALVAASGCDLAMTDLSAKATDEWKKTYTLAEGGRVEVLNVNGPIEVGPSTGRTVEIRAEKIARGASEAAAKEALGRIEIIEEATESGVRVETRLPQGGLFGHGGGEVRYFVKVPANTTLRVKTVNGSVDLQDVSGTLRASTTNGGVNGRALSGSLDAGTTNGTIAVEMNKVGPDGVQLETTNGGIRLQIPKDTAATISARLSNGHIDASSLELQTQGEISRRSLDATLNGGGARIRLSTTNGGITIGGR